MPERLALLEIVDGIFSIELCKQQRCSFYASLGDGNLSYDSDSTCVSNGQSQCQGLSPGTKTPKRYKGRESDQMIPEIHAKKGNKACGLRPCLACRAHLHGPHQCPQKSDVVYLRLVRVWDKCQWLRRNEIVITELRLPKWKLRDAKNSTEISPRCEKLFTVGPERASTPHFLSLSSACQIVCDGAFIQKSHSPTNATLNLRSSVVAGLFGQLVWGRGGSG